MFFLRVQGGCFSSDDRQEEKVETLLGIVRSTTGKEPKCIDCKRHKLYPADPVLIFSSPKHRCTAVIDIVTGKTIETDCYAMRHERCECGPAAKLFQARAKDGDAPEEEKTPPPQPAEPVNKLWVAFLLLVSLALLALIYWAYVKDGLNPTKRRRIIPGSSKPGKSR